MPGLTRKQWEAKVLEVVRNDGGFSVFWATEKGLLARAIARLEKAGEIVRDGGKFPWCAYKLKEVQRDTGS